jgi:hypothetical protein
LDGAEVKRITPLLEAAGRFEGVPERLVENVGSSFSGSKLDAMGFILTSEEAEGLIAANPKNSEIVMPYLNGEDLTSRPDCSAARWVVNFRDWSRDRAESYEDCFDLLRRRVLPEVEGKGPSYSGWLERWWQFWRVRSELYSRIADMKRVLAIAQVSKVVLPLFVPANQVLSMMLIVFVYDDDAHFGLLTSALHYWWAVSRASTLETRIRYTPTDCFDTFPQPKLTEDVERTGGLLERHRRQLMLERSEGLTVTYNRVHSSDEVSTDIGELRRLHVDLDHAVTAAYGWDDLDLDHDFHETRQGTRYTIGPEARQEILDRLLELNHERQMAVGGFQGAKTKKIRSRVASSHRSEQATETLFGDDEFIGDS